jgi:hypothetical protein
VWKLSYATKSGFLPQCGEKSGLTMRATTSIVLSSTDALQAGSELDTFFTFKAETASDFGSTISIFRWRRPIMVM